MVSAADSNLVGWNAPYMHPGERVAKTAHVKAFIGALRARVGDALLTTIIAYELENEMHANGVYPPFCCAFTPPYACANNPSFACTGVVVQTADGLSCDISDPAQRQQAWDANAVSYANDLGVGALLLAFGGCGDDAKQEAEPAASDSTRSCWKRVWEIIHNPTRRRMRC